MAPKLALILNLEAGGAGQDKLTEIEKLLAEAGPEYRLMEASDHTTAEEMAAQAIKEGADHLCACGGDGTVAQIVNGIMKSGRRGLRLSIVPLGTANLIAEALGIPTEIEEAVKTIRAGALREIDVGRIDGHYFVLGLGIGATERFVTQTGDFAKKKFGRLAYVLSLLRQTKAEPFQMQIEVDGRQVWADKAEASTLGNFWGKPHLKLLKDSTPDDGKMELVINERLTKWGLIRLAWKGVSGRLGSDEDVTVIKGSTFQISTQPTLPVQLDGNESGLMTPFRVEVLDRALTICICAGDPS